MPIPPQYCEIPLASLPFMLRPHVCVRWPTAEYGHARARMAGRCGSTMTSRTRAIGVAMPATSKDRSRDHLQATPPSLALWMPNLRAPHGGVRFVGVNDCCDARDIAIVCKSLPAQWSIVSDTLSCHIWGPCEALVVILGGSDASDGCSFTWYRIERAVSTYLPPISGTSCMWASVGRMFALHLPALADACARLHAPAAYLGA